MKLKHWARARPIRAGTAFAIEKLGDVQVTWENEALREVAESKGDLQIVYPKLTILAEPVVAWVDANVSKHGTAAAAQAHLEYLFSDAAQEIIALMAIVRIAPRS